jgi:hypothetical protein
MYIISLETKTGSQRIPPAVANLASPLGSCTSVFAYHSSDLVAEVSS